MMARILNFILLSNFFFLGACSKPFPGGESLILLSLLEEATKIHYVFVTSSTFDGALGGVGGADLKCQTAKGTDAADLPGTSLEYVALIAAAARVPGGVGWPLVAGKNYYAMDPTQTLIFHTDSSGLPTIPLDNAGGIPGGGTYWTGLGLTTFTIADTCLDWTDSTGGQSGDFGSSGTDTYDSFNQTFSDPCNSNHSLLCVRN
ncbi:DUF1554 domain-containing protein [Leptospira sarikeiensis]|uniref:DUF1554 domain-containing protein n=1 Tax=Leptospira sarikeiensis TaxID=2484943 RepID=A0A4R9K9D2_9LEPT|nr:DUF1554 domain-containing protein [Leptospira sarikeiensis]TGL62040.1 DUF1554 domain-containing protein [Leptospira sarikeiensis]